MSVYTSHFTRPLGGSDAIRVRGEQTTRRVMRREKDLVTPITMLDLPIGK